MQRVSRWKQIPRLPGGGDSLDFLLQRRQRATDTNEPFQDKRKKKKQQQQHFQLVCFPKTWRGGREVKDSLLVDAVFASSSLRAILGFLLSARTLELTSGAYENGSAEHARASHIKLMPGGRVCIPSSITAPAGLGRDAPPFVFTWRGGWKLLISIRRGRAVNDNVSTVAFRSREPYHGPFYSRRESAVIMGNGDLTTSGLSCAAPVLLETNKL